VADPAPPAARRRLAVLGSPIAHSKSPTLHAAAYRVLGLDWEYSSAEVTTDALPGFLAGLDDAWRGLSLTMPLKRDVVPLLTDADELVRLTAVANTVLLTDAGPIGFNTDVYGIQESFRRAGVPRPGHVLILGGGATAASAIVAAERMRAASVTVALRDPSKDAALAALAGELELDFAVGGLAPLPRRAAGPFDTVISTLPNGAQVHLDTSPVVRPDTVLFDVAYEPWPTPLAAGWSGPVIAGIEMLVHQAVAQIRVFVAADPATALPDEPRVLAGMRAAVGLP
jgi:shikimate dehydrogenase